jgi:hypothetical protein
MALTNAEKEKLKTFASLFNVLNLNREQVEAVISRSLTTREWKSCNRDYKLIFSQVAKQAKNVAAKKFKVKKFKPSESDLEVLRFKKHQAKHREVFKKVFMKRQKRIT